MGNQAGIIIRNVKNELFHSAKRLILNEVKGIECLRWMHQIISMLRERLEPLIFLPCGYVPRYKEGQDAA